MEKITVKDVCSNLLYLCPACHDKEGECL